MRLGQVVFSLRYVVDLDNPEMVEHATDALYDDIWQMGKDSDIARLIRIVPAEPTATPDDIPSFLLDEDE